MIPSTAELRSLAELSPDGTTEWESAFHEAGHVVAEVHINASFPDAVWLAESADVPYAGRTLTRSFLGVEREGQEAHRRYAIVLAAGDIARDLAMDWKIDFGEYVLAVVDGVSTGDPDGITDTELIAQLTAGMSDYEAETFIEEAYEAAASCLAERWCEVERVAEALVERRHLGRRDLFDMLEVDCSA